MSVRKISPAAFARLWADHSLTSDEIGARLGMTGAGVRWRAKQLGLPPRPGGGGRRYSDPDLFARMWTAGVPCAEIARHFGYAGPQSVSVTARNLGLPRRVKGPSGRRNGGWAGGMSLAAFLDQMRLARMAEVAAREKRAHAAIWGRRRGEERDAA